MKKIIILFIIINISLSAYSQWEFKYFVLRFGANHHLLSPQPDTLNNLYLDTYDGEMRLFPDTAYFFDYVPGYHAGLHFHFDFSNDMGGIVAGVEYQNSGISEKYVTSQGGYSLVRTHWVHSVGFPLYIKFGREIFDQQKYLFAGVKYNINFAMQTREKVSWAIEPRTTWYSENQFAQNNIVILLGFNFLIFNLEFDFMPSTFLNKEYAIGGGGPNPQTIKPYSSQKDRIFFIKTSINIPLSPWTTNKSYFLHKLVRKFK